jgi:hypothetical protein
MKISIMWMTRKRSHELIYSLSSFIMNAKNNSDIEYIIVNDPDDIETISALEKIVTMSSIYDAEIISCTTDKRYGYEELEQYQNLAGKVFTGECLMIMNDDVVCINKNWDEELRNELQPVKDKPAWIGICGANEAWKGATTFVGINRKWYETTGRVSGNRATDGYLMDLGEAANIKPLKPKLEIIHLQRGRSAVEYIKDGVKKYLPGLPDDGLGGYPTKNPIPPKYYHKLFEPNTPATNFVEGKKRFDEDLSKLLGNM